MIRRVLDIILDAAAALAVAGLVAIAALIAAEVVARQFHTQIQGVDDFSVYALAASGLLGLGPTYRANEHIRVGMLVDRISGAWRHRLEVVLLAVALVCVLWATVWATLYVRDAWRFNEMSQGLVAIPLWIPQMVMPLGFGVFALVLLDDLLTALRGGTPSSLGRGDVGASLSDR